jgi:hypothetical protein
MLCTTYGHLIRGYDEELANRLDGLSVERSAASSRPERGPEVIALPAR